MDPPWSVVARGPSMPVPELTQADRCWGCPSFAAKRRAHTFPSHTELERAVVSDRSRVIDPRLQSPAARSVGTRRYHDGLAGETPHRAAVPLNTPRGPRFEGPGE